MDLSNRRVLFQQELLRWYRSQGRRRFAWRDGKRNAYQILIAEVMLRKTDTGKVAHVYEAFVQKYPTSKALAKAKETSLRDEIRSLGIADRARLLKLMAKQITDHYGGRVPRAVEALLRLPGVGRYTANAVLCFAFRRDVPLLDTNVIRVLSRVFSVRSKVSRPRDDPDLWRFTAELVPKGNAVSFNRAILDFAAQICTHRAPRCMLCPQAPICDYYATLVSSTPSVPADASRTQEGWP